MRVRTLTDRPWSFLLPFPFAPLPLLKEMRTRMRQLPRTRRNDPSGRPIDAKHLRHIALRGGPSSDANRPNECRTILPDVPFDLAVESVVTSAAKMIALDGVSRQFVRLCTAAVTVSVCACGGGSAPSQPTTPTVPTTPTPTTPTNTWSVTGQVVVTGSQEAVGGATITPA